MAKQRIVTIVYNFVPSARINLADCLARQAESHGGTSNKSPHDEKNKECSCM